MEELTAALAGSFEISMEPNKTSAPHPRYSQYKQKSSSNDQDSRRKKLLEIQKSHRFNFMNHVRKLTEDDWCPGEKDSEKSAERSDRDSEEMMDAESVFLKPGRFYKDQLMLSEWLVEVPSDFEREWLTVLCPVAKRCLIVASRGKTKAFTKSGYCMNTFPSHLPGGYHKNPEKDTTILDCLYSEVNNTYYILDLMCWNGHAVYDSETEFRFYWLHEKLQEFSMLDHISRVNPFKFVGLPSFRCTTEDIASAVISATFEIDGILFFHKRTHYTFGSTPLVVWLKPYMLKEILGIIVPESQMSHMPEGYTNYADHMKKVEEDREKQKKGKQSLIQSRGRGRAQGRGHGRGRGRGRGHFKHSMEFETTHADEESDKSLIEETVMDNKHSLDISSHESDGMEVSDLANKKSRGRGRCQGRGRGRGRGHCKHSMEFETTHADEEQDKSLTEETVMDNKLSLDISSHESDGMEVHVSNLANKKVT